MTNTLADSRVASLSLACWLGLVILFVALRLDTSERSYFEVDDRVVVWLVDDAVNNGNWQPDWYRAEPHLKLPQQLRAQQQNIDLPHPHHYNFSGHMLLSALLIKPLRALGIATPTIVLLHHIALAWDTLSCLLVVAAARQLGGHALALPAALVYTLLPLAVQGSHYARPDAFLTAMGSLMLWLALQPLRWRTVLAAGLTLGAATAGKASQLMIGIYPALVFLLALVGAARGARLHTLARQLAQGTVLLLAAALPLAIMFVGADMAPKDFWLSLLSVQQYYLHPLPPDRLEHYSFFIQLGRIAHYFYSTLGWPLLAAMLAGIVSLTHSRQWLALALLTMPWLLFTLYFSSVPAFFDRSFCALSGGMALLAALGVQVVIQALRIPRLREATTLLIAMLACWKPVAINYHLQTDHLRDHHNDDRLAFQRELKRSWNEKHGTDFWIRNINNMDMFAGLLPAKPSGNPRIHVLADFNDWNSRVYLQTLLANGFVPIAEFTGDFADMPTNSLLTVHEAARFRYLVRREDMPAGAIISSPAPP